MNSSLVFDGKTYISSRRAAELTKYSNDYVGQLCREKKIDGRKIGRAWFVDQQSLITYKQFSDEQAAKLSAEASKISKQSTAVKISALPSVNSSSSPQKNIRRDAHGYYREYDPNADFRSVYGRDERPLLPTLNKKLTSTGKVSRLDEVKKVPEFITGAPVHAGAEAIKSIIHKTRQRSLMRGRNKYQKRVRSIYGPALVGALVFIIGLFQFRSVIFNEEPGRLQLADSLAPVVNAIARDAKFIIDGAMSASIIDNVSQSLQTFIGTVRSGVLALFGIHGGSPTVLVIVPTNIPTAVTINSPVISTSRPAPTQTPSAAAKSLVAANALTTSVVHDRLILQPQTIEISRMDPTLAQRITDIENRLATFQVLKDLQLDSLAWNLGANSGGGGGSGGFSGGALSATTGTFSSDVSVAGNLSVSGSATFSNVSSANFSGPVTATIFNTTSTTASSTFANGVNLTGGCFSVNGTCIGGAAGNGSGTVTSVDASGGSTGLSFSGGAITTSGTLTLGGTLNVANGGTGAATFGQGWIYSSGGTTAYSASTSPTVAWLTATSTTATSSFYGNVNVNGNASTTFLTVSGNATSSFASGINLKTGCFAVNGNCVAGTVTSVDGSGGSTGLTLTGGPITNTGTLTLGGTLNVSNGGTGAATFGQGWIYSSGGTTAYGASTSPTVAWLVATSTSKASIFPYASTTALTVSGASGFYLNSSLNGPLQAIAGLVSSTSTLSGSYGGTGISSYASGDILYADANGNLARLAKSSDSLVLKLNGGLPSWQTDITSSGGSSGSTAWATTTNNLVIYPTDTTNTVVIGGMATTGTSNIFEVIGNTKLGSLATIGNLLAMGSSTLQNFTFQNATGSSISLIGTNSTSTFSGNVNINGNASTTFLTVSGNATSSFASGINVTSGCFSVNGVCTGKVSSVDASGGTTGLSFSGGPVTTTGTLTLSGTLNVANGGTGAATFSQGWIYSPGGTTALAASTSPTVAWITATSTSRASTFPYASTTFISSTNGAAFATLGGNVGIGSSTPISKLYVYDTVAPVTFETKGTFTNSSANVLTLEAMSSNTVVDGGGPAITFNLATNSGDYNQNGQIGMFRDGGISSGAFYIRPALNSNFTTRAVFLSNGNVGFGTTSPNWNFQVAGARPSIALSDTSATTNQKHWLLSSIGGTFYIGTSTDTFATSTPSALTVTNSGNFGIGTSSPGSLLSIGQTANFTTGTSTFASTGGINLLNGCFSVNGVCTGKVSSVDASGGTTGLSFSGGPVTTTGTLTLSGTLNVANGGTGAATFSQGWISSAGGTGALTSSTSPTVAWITATSTNATSSFYGNVNVNGNASTSQLTVSGNATSSFASGINITTGCFAVNGQCVVNSSAGTGTVNNGTQGQTAFYSGNGTAVSGTSTISIAQSTNVGIGTTSPFAKFSIHANNNEANTALFTVAFSTQTSTTTLLTFNNLGFLGLGTSSPYAVLSVVGASGIVADNINATNTSATSTLAGGVTIGGGLLNYDFSTGITSASALQIGGSFSFDINAGVVSWADLPIDSNAPVNTPESYSAQLNSNPVLTVFGKADGLGKIIGTSTAVGIGTTTPFAKLSVGGNGTTTGWAFAVSDISSTTRFVIQDNGNVGLGTTSPYAILAIHAPSGNTTPLFAVATTSSVSPAFAIDKNGLFTVNTPAATSTINGNLFVNGTLRSTNSYVGDLIFGNNFRILEAPTSSPSQALILQNQRSENIFTLDENGSLTLGATSTDQNSSPVPSVLTVTGDLCIKGECVAKSLNSLSSRITALSNASLATSTTDSVQTVAQAMTDMNLKLEALSATTSALEAKVSALELKVNKNVDDLANAAAAWNANSSANASSTVSGTASSTASLLSVSTGFVQTIATAVQNAIQSAGDWAINRVSAHIVYSDRIETQTAAISKGLEITDQATNQIWCVTLKNGEWDKVLGTCAAVASSTVPIVNPPAPIISPVSTIAPGTNISSTTPQTPPIDISSPPLPPVITVTGTSTGSSTVFVPPSIESSANPAPQASSQPLSDISPPPVAPSADTPITSSSSEIQ